MRAIKSGEFDAIRELCKAVLLDDFAKEQYALLEMQDGECEERCPYELPMNCCQHKR